MRLTSYTWVCCLLVAASPASAATPASERVSYNHDVRPILSDNCFACHGPDAHQRKAGLRLDQADAATAELESGHRAIVPGEPNVSELVARITHDDPEQRMPPAESHKTLTADQKQVLRTWIAQGATYQKHWAFVPPKRPDLPAVEKTSWPINPIDRFVLARLEHEGLSPSPPADRVTLARRVHFDLTGLPPTLAQVRAFVADASPDAYEQLVDQLLASEHYGERMAMPWLDAARYADTNGFSIDDHRAMWVWRDWVIDAFNRNMPYDRFVIEQLAGDMLPDASERQKIATGFLRNSMNTHEGGTLPEEYRVIYLADKVDAVSTVFLGLTMRCAQCHDHKYDPVTQKDYYRFYAFFDRAVERGKGATNGNTEPTLAVEPIIGDVETMRARLQRRMDTLSHWRDQLESKQAEPSPRAVALFDLEHVDRARALNTIKAEIGVLRKQVEQGRVNTMVMAERGNPGPTYLLKRGAYDQPDKSKALSPGVPRVLGALPDDAPANRLGLARWLTSPDHPLTARVAVNRYWQMLFGRGLVATANDLGMQGEMPSHPELLDWLARQYIDSGWDTKALIKRIVMSATYRQASDATTKQKRRDPRNVLLGRGARFRLPAELVRDNALAVSGLLNRDVGGPSVHPMQPAGLWREVSHYGHPTAFTAQVFVPDRGADLRRRSLYTFWKRTSPPPTMAAFDAPTREVCTMQRSRTNTPLQALVLLNEPQFVDAARALAAMAMRDGGAGPAEKATFMFQRATLREPTERERAVLIERYERAKARYAEQPSAARRLIEPITFDAPEGLDPIEHAAWTVAAGVVLNLDETITKE